MYLYDKIFKEFYLDFDYNRNYYEFCLLSKVMILSRSRDNILFLFDKKRSKYKVLYLVKWLKMLEFDSYKW